VIPQHIRETRSGLNKIKHAIGTTSPVEVALAMLLPLHYFDPDGIRDAAELGGLYLTDQQAEALTVALALRYQTVLATLTDSPIKLSLPKQVKAGVEGA
jgi:hypothetical protein